MPTWMVVLSTAVAACGGGEADGMLELRIYGEAYIEEHIPEEIFVDGWTVTYDKFLVNVGDVEAVQGEDGEPALSDGTFRIFDLSQPSDGVGHLVVSERVAGGAYDHVAYRLAPALGDAVAGNVSPEDVELMKTEGASIHVEGTATKGDRIVTFVWPFETATRYRACHSTAVVDGQTAQSQLTIHGDHLLYDDLFSSEPNVAFDLIAESDADTDGVVTVAELTDKALATEERYQVSSTGVDNLWDFIARQSTTVGHIDGEGHCESELEE